MASERTSGDINTIKEAVAALHEYGIIARLGRDFFEKESVQRAWADVAARQDLANRDEAEKYILLTRARDVLMRDDADTLAGIKKEQDER